MQLSNVSMLYWIIAWLMMLLAFLAASGAILLGARRLDRESEDRERRSLERSVSDVPVDGDRQ